MNRLSFIIMVLLSLPVFAQDNTTKNTFSEYYTREDKLILNFTLDHWSKLSPDINSKDFRSRGFSFLIMQEMKNKSGRVGLGAGLGFTSQNVHTDAYLVDTTSTESGYIFEKIPDSLEYTLNKLSLNFITAALEIRIHTNVNKKRERFKFNFGITGGILVQSHTKYDDKNGKIKTYNVRYLNDFQYGLSGRIGYSNYALYGYYSLVDVFEEGKGPELIPYSFGISLTF